MSKGRMVYLGLASLVLVLTCGYLYIDYVFGRFAECRIVQVASTPSPSGEKSVIVFRKECNATVPNSTHASIAPSGTDFSPERSSPFFGVPGNQDILATWSGDRVVKIGVVPGSSRTLEREQSVGDIRIEY
jgi:hypothetical protein